jgi:transposase
MIAGTPEGAPAMNATGTITMTMREVDRLKVIEAVTDGRLKPGQAAGRLGLSVRQIERLVLRYRAFGVAGLRPALGLGAHFRLRACY